MSELLKVDWQSYSLPLRRPFRTAFGVLENREGLLVRLEAADGSFGWGEIAPLSGFGGESLADSGDALKLIQSYLSGNGLETPAGPDLLSVLDLLSSEDPFAFDRVLEDAIPDAPCARAGLAFAFADLKAQQAGLPLASWLRRIAADPDEGSLDSAGGDGGRLPEAVAVNATIGVLSLADCAEAAKDLLGEGYRTLKVKLGMDDPTDIARVKVVREAVGDQVSLRLDANGAWDFERALKMLKAFEPYGIEYIEQPLPAGQLAQPGADGWDRSDGRRWGSLPFAGALIRAYRSG